MGEFLNSFQVLGLFKKTIKKLNNIKLEPKFIKCILSRFFSARDI